MNIEKYTATLHAILYQTRKGFCNIPRDVLTYKTSAIKWSKREILGHLIDSARYNLMRFTISDTGRSPSAHIVANA